MEPARPGAVELQLQRGHELQSPRYSQTAVGRMAGPTPISDTHTGTHRFSTGSMLPLLNMTLQWDQLPGVGPWEGFPHTSPRYAWTALQGFSCGKVSESALFRMNQHKVTALLHLMQCCR